MHCGILMLARTGTYKYSVGGGGEVSWLISINLMLNVKVLGRFSQVYFFCRKKQTFQVGHKRVEFICLFGSQLSFWTQNIDVGLYKMSETKFLLFFREFVFKEIERGKH